MRGALNSDVQATPYTRPLGWEVALVFIKLSWWFQCVAKLGKHPLRWCYLCMLSWRWILYGFEVSNSPFNFLQQTPIQVIQSWWTDSELSWSVARQSAQPGWYNLYHLGTWSDEGSLPKGKLFLTYAILRWTCHNFFSPLWNLMFF